MRDVGSGADSVVCRMKNSTGCPPEADVFDHPGGPNDAGLSMSLSVQVSRVCRFLGRGKVPAVMVVRLLASEKRQGTKSRDVGSGGAADIMGI